MVILTVLENITQKNKITAQKIMVIETKTSIRYSKTSKKEKTLKRLLIKYELTSKLGIMMGNIS